MARTLFHSVSKVAPVLALLFLGNGAFAAERNAGLTKQQAAEARKQIRSDARTHVFKSIKADGFKNPRVKVDFYRNQRGNLAAAATVSGKGKFGMTGQQMGRWPLKAADFKVQAERLNGPGGIATATRQGPWTTAMMPLTAARPGPAAAAAGGRR